LHGALSAPPHQRILAFICRELQEQVEAGVNKLLQEQQARSTEIEAATLKDLKQQLQAVEADIKADREQLGGEQADLMARTVCSQNLCKYRVLSNVHIVG
jgi:hypothetical protein